MDIVSLSGVDFAYPGGPQILRGLDFRLSQGDRAGIVGRNGAGKSTLFRLAMGLLRPTRGELSCFDKPLVSEKDFLAARRQIGFVFQDSDDQLFCPTVFEDVAFGPLNLGLDRELVKQKVTGALEALGLGGFERRLVHQLSGGEKRLTALAGVLAMEPRAVLLDEPSTGLDDDHADRFEAMLLGNVPTFAVVSHDRDFLARTCNKLYLLDDGRLTALPT
ncbi:MAG: ABC transporter ATP-binding protein [Desulfovibrionaceae bacterium]|nr:ABC transporter ATP-binding protein [Desulfovibrionaceae bacterium]MBF0512726.1 ABC transporter ATP-binding protein [Desulfovibrionaceae bacterium]